MGIKKGVRFCLVIFKKGFQFCLGIFNTVNAMREFGSVMEYSRLSIKELSSEFKNTQDCQGSLVLCGNI